MLFRSTGTPAYMAPEQADGQGGFDGRADVYSLAVVTWELLSGSRPALEPVATGGRRSGGRTPPRRPHPAIAGISPPLVDFLTAALDPDPGRRPRDAHAFARELVAASTATRAVPPAGWSALGVWAVALVVFGVAMLVGWLVL